MSYRVRLYNENGYRWWINRADYVVVEIPIDATDYFLLMETNDYLLLEDGFKIVLE